jgi:DNA-directed RNA polymerase subunit alpha
MKFYSIEKTKKKNTELSETFIIEPFEHGQALTFGNAIRRALLSETYGFAITQVQINEIENEFEQAPFLREDTLEILLNLKQILFKPGLPFIANADENDVEYKIITKIKGPIIITAGMLNVPKEIAVINPNQYLGTIIDNSELNLVLTLKYDKAYKLLDSLDDLDNYKNDSFEAVFKNEGFPINLDVFFVPIKKVNYKIKTTRDTEGNLKESLLIEITTNGTLTPKRAFLQSLNSCLKLFYNVFLSVIKANNLKKI